MKKVLPTSIYLTKNKKVYSKTIDAELIKKIILTLIAISLGIIDGILVGKIVCDLLDMIEKEAL